MTAMSRSPHPTRQRLRSALRVVLALASAYLGALLAFGSYLAMLWQLNPSPGNTGSTLAAVGFGLLMGALVIAPMAAWWFLAPWARWWGIPITALLTIGTFTTFLSTI
jgi:hypothetical protein